MSKSSVRTLTTLLLSATIAATTLAAGGDAAASGCDRIEVDRLVFPVTLADGNTYDVVGYLYYKGNYRFRPLQVLVHGLTYTHEYWDLPSIGGRDYSYARYMAERNYAVLALDLPGTGESDRPDGDFLDLAQTAESVHQVLTEMREPGGVFKAPFHRIALVGHSNGSVTSTAVQGTYNDADVLVNTGFVFTPHPIPVDPAAIGALLGSPYVTFPSEMRTALFYDAATSNPALVRYDNAHVANTTTRGEFLSMLAVSDDPSLAGVGDVTSPVLIQLATHDVLEPASYADEDETLFTNAESVTTAVVTEAGHSLNGHIRPSVGWAQIDHWLRRTLR